MQYNISSLSLIQPNPQSILIHSVEPFIYVLLCVNYTARLGDPSRNGKEKSGQCGKIATKNQRYKALYSGVNSGKTMDFTFRNIGKTIEIYGKIFLAGHGGERQCQNTFYQISSNPPLFPRLPNRSATLDLLCYSP